MIDSRFKNKSCLILNELTEELRRFWFELKQQKFLHNIDTFYYSVKLSNDFTKDSKDVSAKQLRSFFSRLSPASYEDDLIPLFFNGLQGIYNYRPYIRCGFYTICIECPEQFDILIAPSVPKGAEGESVTSEIICQIRSCMLWMHGVHESFRKSFEAVKGICQFFRLEIIEVKENRIDYCWHSNYLQNPEEYFRIDRFAKMQVSRYRRIHMEYAFGPNDEYECDYICLGRRSDKCFVRIYLKSKEVIEQAYKPWFFKIWLFHGLINRYDLYLYEQAFLNGSWDYIDMARLEFYREHGGDKNLISECSDILDGRKAVAAEHIRKLADHLTPRVTLITNVEYQTMRRSSKSYTLLPLKDNSCFGVCRRIYDYFDNRRLISDYLTHSILRLVNPDEKDTNKSRRGYVAFWSALRHTKQVDVAVPPPKLKLIRDYSRRLNSNIIKSRMLNQAVTYGIYTRGINDDDVLEDCTEALLRLNDNDIERMRQYKHKKVRQYDNEQLADTIEEVRRSYYIVTNDGEYYDYYNTSSLRKQEKSEK